MSLRLYNTLTSRKEPFTSIEPQHARIYVCGPTVYDYAHLGHLRCYIVYDVLVRRIRANGLRVTYVRNVTDIDDKILRRAEERGEDPFALAARFTNAFRHDMQRVGNIDPDIEPKVSDHLADIVALIGRLIDKKAAYVSDGDVYFRVSAFPEYGKLSHRKLDDLELGASGRTEEAESRRKENAADFALWKGSKSDEVGWDSPFGRGRPGWHIECSAMSMRHLGETFDLHGGGLDLVFPHHENEIAQSESATGKPFSRMWVHNGFVEVAKEKMSKSLGNCFVARELFERVEPEALRYFMLTAHYRAPIGLDWTLDEAGNVQNLPQLEDAERRVEYFYNAYTRLSNIPDARIVESGDVPDEIEGFEKRIGDALDEDLNTPAAIARASELLRAVNELCDEATRKKGKVSARSVATAKRAFVVMRELLGLGFQEPQVVLARIRDRRARARGVSNDLVEQKIAARSEARTAKRFSDADQLRDELAALGVELHDGPNGTTWSMP